MAKARCIGRSGDCFTNGCVYEGSLESRGRLGGHWFNAASWNNKPQDDPHTVPMFPGEYELLEEDDTSNGE